MTSSNKIFFLISTLSLCLKTQASSRQGISALRNVALVGRSVSKKVNSCLPALTAGSSLVRRPQKRTFNSASSCSYRSGWLAAGVGLAAANSLSTEDTPDLHTRDKFGNTPLVSAVRKEKPEVVRALIGAGADVNEISRGDTALSAAIYVANREIVKILVSAGAHLNQVDKEGRTPLIQAVYRGDLSIVQLLIDGGADLSAKDERAGETALMVAEKKRLPQMVEALTRAGSPSSSQRPHGLLVTAAARNGDHKTVQELILKGADINCGDQSGWTPLMFAVKTNHPETVKLLLLTAEKRDINAKNKDKGETALMIAASRGNDEIVELLLNAGADPDKVNFDVGTALMLAIISPYTERVKINVIKKLLAAGADLSWQDPLNGNTALRVAREEGLSDIVNLLREHQRSQPNGLLLIQAAKDEDLESVQLLIDAGAQVNQTDEFGWTPLMHAACKGNIEINQLLLNAGADLSAKEERTGKTALMIARLRQHTKVIELLESAEANQKP